MPSVRRFPPPWSVDDPDKKLGQDCFIVRDANGQALAYVYFEGEAGTPFPPFERPWSLWRNQDYLAAFMQWRQCKPRVGGKWPRSRGPRPQPTIVVSRQSACTWLNSIQSAKRP